MPAMQTPSDNPRRMHTIVALLYACVVAGGFFIVRGLHRVSHQTEIPFAIATTGPAWGRQIPEITLSGKSFGQAIEELAAASGARVEVLWEKLPDYLTAQTPVPPEIKLHNVSLGQALNLLIDFCEKENDRREGKIVCRAVKGKIYVAAADAGPAAAPALRTYDVRDLLASMRAFRAKHPEFHDGPAEWFGMSPDSVERSVPDAAAPTTSGPVDLAYFLRFGIGLSQLSNLIGDCSVADGRVIAIAPHEVLDGIGANLESIRSAGQPLQPAPHEPMGITDASAQLERILPEVQISSSLLPDAVEKLRQISGANIHANWTRLTLDDLKTRKYDLHLRNVTLRSALNSLLDGLPLGIVAEDGVISIMYSELLTWRSIETRAYDASDLMTRKAKLPATQETRFAESHLRNDPQTKAAADLIDALIAAVPDEKWPSTWRTSPVTMVIVGNVLLVRQTPAVHARIQAALANLREGK
jgi:hypothetical protein